MIERCKKCGGHGKAIGRALDDSVMAVDERGEPGHFVTVRLGGTDLPACDKCRGFGWMSGTVKRG